MIENGNDLASRIRTAIKNSGKSQNKVADEAGITRASMSRYVNGERIPKATTMIDLAKALNTSLEWLQTGSMPFDTHIEMIIDYTTDGTDYQYCDNKGVLIRCKACKYWDHEICLIDGVANWRRRDGNGYCSFAVRK